MPEGIQRLTYQLRLALEPKRLENPTVTARETLQQGCTGKQVYARRHRLGSQWYETGDLLPTTRSAASVARPETEHMARKFRTDLAQSRGLGSKKRSGRCRTVFLDFASRYRTLQETAKDISIRYIGRFDDELFEEIRKLNPDLKDSDRLEDGQLIRIPLRAATPVN